MLLGYLLILLSAFGFGLMPIFALYGYDNNVNVSTLLFLRFSFTAMIFFSYIFFKSIKFKLTKNQLLFLFLLGGIFYTMQSTFYFTSVKYIPASLAVLLLYLYPAFVAILSFFVNREKITKQLIISITISLTGMVLVLGSPTGESFNVMGILLAIGAAVVYSLYIIIGNKVSLEVSPVITTAFIALFASISFFILGTFTNSIDFNFGAIGWFSIVSITLFSSVLAMFTFFAGMKIIGPTKASILSMVEPLVTIIFSTLLFQEQMSFLQIVGGLIVLTGAVLVILSKEKATNFKVEKNLPLGEPLKTKTEV